MHRLLRVPLQQLGERDVQVAARSTGNRRATQDTAGHRGHRALAVGARDADDPAAAEARGQLDLAPHRDTRAPGGNQRLDLARNTRADHDQIGRASQRCRVASGVHPRAELAGALGHSAQLPLGAAVGHDHARTVRERQPRRRQAALAQAEHEHVQPPQIGIACGERSMRHRRSHLSFSVASASSAKMMAMIQKRITTFVSLQPASSK